MSDFLYRLDSAIPLDKNLTDKNIRLTFIYIKHELSISGPEISLTKLSPDHSHTARDRVPSLCMAITDLQKHSHSP